MFIQIAIDGPSGSGKSTLAKGVAKKLGILYLDTGAMYRACGLSAIRAGISPKDEEKVKPMLEKMQLSIRYVNEQQRVFLGEDDVSDEIRRPEVSVAASDISAIPEVRLKMVALQQEIAASQSVVLDGRDIGSYVLPNADYKFFLTAKAEERAKRRIAELNQKGIFSQSYEDVLSDIRYRDEQDSSRAFAPLKKMPEAIEIDTTKNEPEDTLFQLLSHLPEGIKKEN